MKIGPRPKGRPWTLEDAQLLVLLNSKMDTFDRPETEADEVGDRHPQEQAQGQEMSAAAVSGYLLMAGGLTWVLAGIVGLVRRPRDDQHDRRG